MIFQGFLHTALEIAAAILPMVFIFIFMHIFYLKLKKYEVMNILKGFLITYVGLVFFMQGVNIAFLSTENYISVGQFLGEALGKRSDNWMLIPIGFLLGFVTAYAEPAVRLVVKQVEELSSGTISANVMLLTISVGVASAVAVSVIKMFLGIPIWWIVLPGYLAVFVLAKFSDETFVAMAFDNGGVATGPMSATFILAFCLGIASVMSGRNAMLDGFGTIALIALVPIITTMLLGVVYKNKREKRESDKQEKKYA